MKVAMTSVDWTKLRILSVIMPPPHGAKLSGHSGHSGLRIG